LLWKEELYSVVPPQTTRPPYTELSKS